MLAYGVDDMTCGHCASTITKAIRAVDAGAKIEVDIGQKLVRVVPTESDADALSDAIKEAGYTPVPQEPEQAVATTAPKSGGCCGCCR